MSDYYDRNGQPISMDQWARSFRSDDRQVESTKLDGDAHVSTVYLGLNHNFGAGPPLIFETLVFGGPLDGEMDRYTTEADARTGHYAMVQRVRDADEGGAS